VTATDPGPAEVVETTSTTVDIETAYREYSARCFNLALRVVRDRQLAQDVVQEVFIALVRWPDRFDASRGALSTYLFTITHRKAVDLVRSKHSKTWRDDVLSSEREFIDPQRSPEDAAVLGDAGARVRRAMAVLRTEERTVIRLGYFGGLSQSEIAKALDIPLGTVKSRTLTALRRLRAELAVAP
jgi:RNA polymerase sigma-70 factor (ECF subfamily)